MFIFSNVFADCGIHRDVIYSHLVLIDANSELPSCNYEIVWREVEGMLTRFPAFLSLYFSRVSSASFFRPVFVDFASVKMFVGTHARLMGTLSS